MKTIKTGQFPYVDAQETHPEKNIGAGDIASLRGFTTRIIYAALPMDTVYPVFPL
ncbi:MAG TPA: hypothetical protein VF313_12680 [Anaerolineaceae bacterium]